MNLRQWVSLAITFMSATIGLTIGLATVSSCSSPSHNVVSGLNPALCGGVSDEQMHEITGYRVTQQYRNSLGCVWSINGFSEGIEFSVYRNSNYLKEARYDNNGHGKVILAHYGKYTELASFREDKTVCELLSPKGDDFVVWTVEKYDLQVDSCQIAGALMERSKLE